MPQRQRRFPPASSARKTYYTLNFTSTNLSPLTRFFFVKQQTILFPFFLSSPGPGPGVPAALARGPPCKNDISQKKEEKWRIKIKEAIFIHYPSLESDKCWTLKWHKLGWPGTGEPKCGSRETTRNPWNGIKLLFLRRLHPNVVISTQYWCAQSKKKKKYFFFRRGEAGKENRETGPGKLTVPDQLRAARIFPFSPPRKRTGRESRDEADFRFYLARSPPQRVAARLALSKDLILFFKIIFRIICTKREREREGGGGGVGVTGDDAAAPAGRTQREKQKKM